MALLLTPTSAEYIAEGFASGALANAMLSVARCCCKNPCNKCPGCQLIKPMRRRLFANRRALHATAFVREWISWPNQAIEAVMKQN